MRKPLLALSLLISASIGATPFEGVLAAHSSAPTTRASGDFSIGSHAVASVSGSAIIQYAMKFLGYPYTATGNSPSTGFSCIGFVSYVYRSLGINLPGDLGGAMAFAPSVAFSNLQPGDILYFQNTVWSGLSHTAIYIGDGKFIHAEWYNRGVVISSFTNDPVDGNYWTSHYLGANRPWTGAAEGAVPTPPAVQPSSPSRPTRITTTPPARVPARRPSGPTAIVRVPALNVRSGPSLRAALSTVILRGTRVVVLGQRHGWYKIGLSGGDIGWVIGIGIRRGTAARQKVPLTLRHSNTNVSAGSSIRQPTAAKRKHTPTRIQTHGIVTVTVNALRVHTAPSFGARLIGLVNRSQRLPVVSRGRWWIRVRLPQGGSGWIGSQFVRSQAGRRMPSATTRSHPGSIARAALNVRQRPSLGAAIVSILPAGGSYQILGWSGGWAHVRLADGSTGWISGSVVRSTAPSTRSSRTRGGSSVSTARTASGTAPVVTAGVRIHSRPGIDSPVIGLVAAGTHVRVLGSSGAWTRVRLPTRQTGYILGIYVKG